MRAIQITRPGGADCLAVADLPKPRPAPDEVLIQVKAAGVNRPDIMQRQGLYPPPPGASDIPGLEVAGTVVETGSRVQGFQTGADVCALVTGGGYAEYCTAHERLCLPLPDGFDFIQAAALPEACFTVWANVFERGSLKAGERLLVHGGTSGIGTMAIQLARALCAAEIFTTCGSDKKCQFAMDLGAAVAINYRREDFAESINTFTRGTGIDLILDIIGGPYLESNISLLRHDGRLVIIALQGGLSSQINLLPVMVKRLTITGSTLRPRSVPEKAKIAEAVRGKVWPLLESGQIHPIIHAVFPLEQVQDAHRFMEKSEHIGKIVLTL